MFYPHNCPFSTVDSVFFRKMCNELDPRYNMVECHQIAEIIIPTIYCHECAILKNELKHVNWIAINIGNLNTLKY